MTFKFNSLFVNLLQEANLFNKNELLNNLKEILNSKNITDPNITNWFLKVYPKWYESSDGDNLKSISRHSYVQGEPEWASKEGIFDFKGFSNSEKDELSHIIDYFLSLNDLDRSKIIRQPYSVIKSKVEEWDKQLASKISKTQNKGKEDVDFKTIYRFKDGFSFVKLLSKEAYKCEGDEMGHCVGGYYDIKEITIYSLRDSNGYSHATLECRYKFIYQIKGKQNNAPIQKYHPYIKDFILKGNFTVKRDGENIGMIGYDGEFYFEDSKEWLDVYNTKVIPKQNIRFETIKSYIKNGVYDGDVYLHNCFLKEFPEFLNGIVVNGNFDCSYNQLTSLKNSPKKVNGDFYCDKNQLTSLEGSPEIVSGSFSCHNNQLTTLKGSPKKVNGDFYCDNNQLTSLEGSPKEISGWFNCSHNQLTSLEGPKKVGGDFYCSFNQLTSLEGGPEIVNGGFYCDNNQLTSLEGGPEIVGGDFYCKNNSIKLKKPKYMIVKGHFVTV